MLLNYESPWGKPEKIKKTFNREELDIERLFKRFRGNKGGNSSPNFKNLIMMAFVALLGLWFVTGFYSVDQKEEAVVLRFGKFNRIAKPGLNYHLPAPIETILKIETMSIRREEIGFRSEAPYKTNRLLDARQLAKTAKKTAVHRESLMLTGDENIIDVHFVVHWNIKNIENYFFNLVEPAESVKDAAESAMREVIGYHQIFDALTDKKIEIMQQVKDILQQTLDNYKAGIEILSVELVHAEAPEAVIGAFRDVQTARANMESTINQAIAYRNDILPKARGQANVIYNEALAYKERVVNIANGEASRFNALYSEYEKAKEVTENRLYYEAYEKILTGKEKLMLDDKAGAVPYLALPEMLKKNNSGK